MSRIERRRLVVKLYQGNYESQIADLAQKAVTGSSAPAGPRRQGEKPKDNLDFARKHDELVAEAEETAVEVLVWAVSNTTWNQLALEHPARTDVSEAGALLFPEDKERGGYNMATFPAALLRVSLLAPADFDADTASFAAELVTAGLTAAPGDSAETLSRKGGEALALLGDISRLHYVKLETGAWNVNVGDDALPKYSLVSLLTAESGRDSEQPSEQA